MQQLVTKLKQYLKRPLYRYLLVGGSIYILELVVIVVAQALGAGPVVAVAWSFWIGLLCSFGLQKLFTFSDRRLHHRIVIPQLLAVTLLVLWNFGFTVLVAKLLVHYIPAVVSRTLALGITTIWNFYLYKTKIFKTNSDVVY